MASQVDICNLSLSLLGKEANLSSIDPPFGRGTSVAVESCATFYPMARDLLLAAHAWGFATTRKALVELSDVEPPASWGFAYQVPEGCLRILAVLPEDASDDEAAAPHIVETTAAGVQVLYTNEENATLRYIFREVDPMRYSPPAVMALAVLLASFLAGPIIRGAEGVKLGMAQRKAYEEVFLPQARAQDARAEYASDQGSITPPSIAARA